MKKKEIEIRMGLLKSCIRINEKYDFELSMRGAEIKRLEKEYNKLNMKIKENNNEIDKLKKELELI